MLYIQVIINMSTFRRKRISFFARLRNYFITGIVVLIPIGLTLYLTKFIIDFSIFFYISSLPGDFCEGVIPDPIPNSEVKPFSADGTLS